MEKSATEGYIQPEPVNKRGNRPRERRWEPALQVGVNGPQERRPGIAVKPMCLTPTLRSGVHHSFGIGRAEIRMTQLSCAMSSSGSSISLLITGYATMTREPLELNAVTIGHCLCVRVVDVTGKCINRTSCRA